MEIVKRGYYAVLVVSMLLSSYLVNAQCGTPTITQSDYCLNQKAEVRITDANSAVRYRWFERLGLGNLSDLQYGEDGQGRYFVSNQNVTSTGSHYFYYVREQQYNNIGPNYRAAAGGQLYAVNQTSYDMQFDATVGFRLDTVSVIVEMTSAVDDYMFEVIYVNSANDTTFSLLQTSPRSAFESLGGNLYHVRIPVIDASLQTQGVSIDPGTNQTIEFRSVDAPNGTDYIAVDNIYWWGAGEYAGGGTYASGTIDVFDSEDLVNSDTRTPLIMNWAITQTCDLDSVEVTQSLSCCTPVGTDVNLTSDAFQNLVQPGQLPVTLTASGADVTPGTYLYWFDAAGTEVGGGLNMTTFSANATGIYTVRVVNAAADKESAACYTKTSIFLDSTNIYTNGDQSLCVGNTVNLEAFGGQGNYVWSQISGPSATINTPNSSSSTVDIITPGTYVFEVEADVLLDDIATDGQFEQFDDAANFDINLQPRLFETSYGRATGGSGVFIQNNGQMRIDDDIVAWSANGNAICNGLETPAHGKFLYADSKTSGIAPGYSGGNPIPTAWALEAPMWQLTNQPVAQNTTYFFSIDVAEWGPGGANASRMMLHVNGVPLDLFEGATNNGPVYQVPSTCGWHTITGTWNSGTNTNATITVSEVSKTNIGFELAVDNITFNAGLGREVSTVTIVVDQVDDPGTNTYCDGGGISTDLSVDGTTPYSWFEDQGGTTTLTNSNSPGAIVTWNPPLGTTGDQTFYVANSASTSIPGVTGVTDPINGWAVGNRSVDFTVSSSINIVSMTVKKEAWNAGCTASGTSNFTLELVQNGSVVQSAVVSATCGSDGVITPNFQGVSPGNYTLRFTTGNWFFINSTSLPAGGPFLTVTGASDGSGIFRNWVIEESSACGSPAPIVVSAVSCCTQLAPTAAVQTGTATICVGGNLVLEATPDVGTTGAITYQWYRDGSAISGAVNATYTVPTTVAATAANYTVTVTSSASCTGESPASAAISVTVNGAPTFTVTDPSDQCDGTVDLSTTVSALTPGAAVLSYWNASTGGATVTNPVSATNSYYIEAVANGCTSARQQVDVVIDQPVTITAATPAAVCSPLTVDITSTVSPVVALTYYDAAAAGGSVITNQATISTGGTYSVQAVNGQCSDVEDIVVTINNSPTFTVTDPSDQCDGTVDLSATVSALTPGTAVLSYWDASIGGATVTNPVSTSNSYFVEAVANGCTSARQQVDVVIDQPVTITAATPAAVCSPSTVDITSTVSPVVALTYYDAAAAGGSVITNQATVASSGTYSVQAVNGQCTDVEDIVVTVNPLPSAAITGGGTVCSGESSQLTITVTGGSSPYDITYNGDNGTGSVTVNDETSPYQFNVTTEETFTVTGVVDDNSCSATSLTGSSVVSFHPGFTMPASQAVTNCPNGTNPEYSVDVTLTGGVGTYEVIATNDLSANVAGTITGGVWTPDAIVPEARTLELKITDQNKCDTVTISGLNRVCSCPEIATMAVKAGEPTTLCVSGPTTSTVLEVAFTGGTGGQLYDFTISEAGGAIANDVVVGHNGDTPYELPNVPPGTYTISGFSGSCSGSVSTDVVILSHPVASAIISGGGDVCTDGSNDTIVNVAITGTELPYTVYYQGGTNPSQLFTSVNDVIRDNVVGNYTIDSIVDVHGCVFSGASVTGTGTIAGITPPVVTLGHSDVLQVGTDQTTLSIADPGAYNIQWLIESGQGVLSTPTTFSTDLTGLTAKDPALNSTTVVSVVVNDANNICASVDDTVTITRVDQTIPDLGSDLKLCENSIFPLQIPLPASIITGIETESIVLDETGGATINTGTRMIDVPALAPNTYRIVYEINHTFNGTVTDTVEIVVDAMPDVAAVQNALIETCADAVNLNAVPVAVGYGKWSVLMASSGNPLVAVADSSNPTASLAPLAVNSTVNLQWSTFNETCVGTTVGLQVDQKGVVTTPIINLDNVDRTGQSVDVCVGTNYALEGAAPNVPNGEGLVWNLASGSGITLPTTLTTGTITPTTKGSIVIEYSITSTVPGCTQETRQLTLEVKDVPDVTSAIITGATSGCQDTVKTYSVSGVTDADASGYVWSFNGGFTGNGSTSNSVDVTLGGTTGGDVSVTASNLCGTSTAVTPFAVGVNLTPSAPGAIAGSIEICKSVTPVSVYTVAADPTATSYTWDLQGITGAVLTPSVDGLSNSIDFTNATSTGGTGTLVVTPSNGCGSGVSTSPYVFTFLTPVAPGVSLSMTVNGVGSTGLNEYCVGEDVTIVTATPTAAPGNAPEFEFFSFINGTPIGGQARSTSATYDISNSVGSSVEVVMYSNSTCATLPATATDDINVTPNNPPIPAIDISSGAICNTQTATAEALNKSGVSYSWFQNGVKTTDNSFTSSVSTTGAYDIYYVMNDGVCPDATSDTVHVDVYQMPVIIINEIGNQKVVSNDEDDKIVPTINAEVISTDPKATANIQWTSNVSWLDNTSIANPGVNPPAEVEGQEYHIITVDLGPNKECVIADSLLIISRLPIKVPNAFSPNGDQKNDKWIINGISTYNSVSVQIFNRWGNRVFSQFTYNEDNAWDGGNYPVGTYYYIIDSSDDNFPGTLNGAVTITK